MPQNSGQEAMTLPNSSVQAVLHIANSFSKVFGGLNDGASDGSNDGVCGGLDDAV